MTSGKAASAIGTVSLSMSRSLLSKKGGKRITDREDIVQRFGVGREFNTYRKFQKLSC